MNRFCAVVAAVAFALAAAPRPGLAQTPPPLGINLNGVSDFSPAWVFVDAFKMARPWRTNLGTLALTPEGWVASLQPGQVADALLFQADVPHPTGTWTLLFEGDGDLSIPFGGTVTSSQPGRMLVDVTTRVGGIGIRLTRTNPANPVKNIRFVMPGFESSFAMQPFHPLFLERLRPFKVLRFMDWLQTNSSLIQEFSERRKPTDAFQVNVDPEGSFGRAQVAIEFMIDLCNTLGADGWFNMPHLASDDYVRRFATLVRDRLRPELKAYIEYSNETWNGIFTQFGFVNDQGTMAGLAPGDFFTAGLRFYSRRAVQVFTLWEQVFGGRDRIVRVLASQAANTYTGETVMAFENAFQKADAYAIAPYVGDELDDAANANLSVTQVLGLMTDSLRGTVTGRIVDNLAITQANGLRFITYEGGQHLTVNTPPFGSPEALALEQLFTNVNRSPAIKPLYQEYLNTWRTQGGGDLFMHFNDVSLYSRFGYWGALEFQDQDPATAPKYQALLDYVGASAGTPGVMLTVTLTGTGSGTVQSAPAGITCGAACSALFASGATVTLTAMPAPNSVFAGFGGDPDCADGVVTLVAATTCTAQFTRLLTVAPASGSLLSTQGFDLVVIDQPGGRTLAGRTVTLNGRDVSASFASCQIPGTLVDGSGTTRRCAGLSGALLQSFAGPGPFMLAVTTMYADASRATDTVTWTIPTSAPGVSLAFSPGPGRLVTTQRFDLVLIVGTGGATVVGGRATFDGADVTARLVACVVPGVLPAGGLTFSCPGLTGGALGAGTHTLAVTLNLSTGATVTGSVTWEVLSNREP